MSPRSAISLVFLSLLAACQSEPKPSVQLVVSNQATGRLTFEPVSAYAEYVELPGVRNELRITLASYRASCERFVPPSAGEAAIFITVVTAAGQRPAPSTYPWSGQTQGSYARPSARIGSHSHLFPAGGSVRLTHVELEPHGRIGGLLAFEFPGDAQRDAMSATGSFQARICRINEARAP